MSLPQKSRDWKGILISLLVIAAVLGLILLTIIAVTPPPGPPRHPGTRLQYNQLQHLLPNTLNATWVSGIYTTCQLLLALGIILD